MQKRGCWCAEMNCVQLQQRTSQFEESIIEHCRMLCVSNTESCKHQTRKQDAGRGKCIVQHAELYKTASMKRSDTVHCANMKKAENWMRYKQHSQKCKLQNAQGQNAQSKDAVCWHTKQEAVMQNAECKDPV